jgi:hypothetical protein
MKHEWDCYKCEECPYVLTISESDDEGGGVLTSHECMCNGECINEEKVLEGK